MEAEKRRRQEEIERLRKEIENKTIGEDEEAAADPPQEPGAGRVQDWLKDAAAANQSSSRSLASKGKPPAPASEKSGRGRDKGGSGGEDDDEEDDMTVTDDGASTDRGPPTVWRLARHGKLRLLKEILNESNVDQRDPRGNTCLHHACMQGKKR
mmetsp:Transcript_47703/g.126489  ORF Transcript_47703/g.126489 Transcript_47703/m.126489 type:complete len:154 (+) Transcript_47703:363-824(+)